MGQNKPPLLRRRILYAFASLLSAVAVVSVVLTGGSLYLYYLSTVKTNTQEVADRFHTELEHLQEELLFRARVLALADQWSRQAQDASSSAQHLEVEAYRWLRSPNLKVDGKGGRDYWLDRDMDEATLKAVFGGKTQLWAEQVEDNRLRFLVAVPETGTAGVENMLLLSLTLDDEWLVRAARRVGGQLALCDVKGRVELSSLPLADFADRQLAESLSTEQVTVGDAIFGYQLFPIEVAGKTLGYFSAFSPATPLQSLAFRLSTLLSAGFILALLVFFFLYHAAILRSTSDLAALAQWAEEHSEGHQGALPPPGRFSEVQALSRVFGGLVERLDSALGQLNVRKEKLEEEVAEKTREAWEQHRLMDSMFSGMEQAVFLAEPEGTLLFVNQAARTLFDVGPGKPVPAELVDCCHCDDDDQVPVQLRIGQRDYLVNCNCLEPANRHLLLAQDVTEQLALEGQLQQAQKLESVGRLASGVAHDFNNALGSILPTVDMLRMRTDDAKSLAYVDSIEHAAVRAADVVRQLLTFSRAAEYDPRPLAFNATVESAINLFRPSAKQVEIVWLPGEQMYPVQGDSTQLQQMILNLALNALDAVEGKGAIRFETWSNEQPPAVHFAVTDSGPGVDPEMAEVIFDPFFTTKKQGEGTGLGLSVAYGVAEHHGGRLRLVLPEQGGSRFEVDLPALMDNGTNANSEGSSSEDIVIGG